MPTGMELVGVAVVAVADGPADLVLRTPELACTLATGAAEGGRAALGLLDAALARWAATQGTLELGPVGAVPPCAGLPPVESVALPPGGWAVGLRAPATAHRADGPTVLPMGTDGRWWHVLPGEGTGAVVFERSGGPPVRLVARPQAVEPPPGLVVEVERGGITIVDLDAPAVYVAVRPERGVGLVAIGDQLAVVGREAGTFDGVLREGQGDPRSLRVVVGEPPEPTDRDLVVRSGGRRTFRPDRAVVEAWSAAPEIVEVALHGPRLRLTGLAPGRAELALRLDDGSVIVLPVAVGR